MDLSNLKYAEGSRRTRKRIGRGLGSGNGKTAGRGENGYYSRRGSSVRRHFEGGQLPIQRRLPKFGFTNVNHKEFQILNLNDLNKFDENSEITPEVLAEKGYVHNATSPIKLLSNGELTKKVTIRIHAASKTAKEAVEKLGGSIEVIS
jgi:large subunit ribosomal protein L15